MKLLDISQVIRSKNSGPYELTFDIIFKTEADFQRVCESGVINAALIAKLYNINEKKVMEIVHFKAAKAIKVTIERPFPSGAIGETDVYGAQQHAPLLDIEV